MNKFSILIANYNNGKYFKDCYDSIVSQSYENWEAIIVDDCSTDNSIEHIEKLILNDSRFTLHKNPENKGCGYTKKKCVDLAKGDFCTFLDPDDALYPEALELSLREFSKNRKIAATYSQLMFCDENLNPIEKSTIAKQIYNNKFFFNVPIQVIHLFVFKKQAYLKTCGINPNLKNAVDQDLYLKILETGDTKFIKNTLYKYRLHSSGISQESSKKSAKESFAKVIHDAMKRRDISSINNLPVPVHFTSAEEIYKLLDYQTKISYRFISRIRKSLMI